jgi:hypothetical protein
MVLTKRDSLCINALRSKYKVDDGWLQMECKQSASQTWKAIDKMKNLIALGACFLIGDGARIDIWKDPWVPWLPIISLHQEMKGLLTEVWLLLV